MRRTPPGPTGSWLMGCLSDFRRDMLGLYTRWLHRWALLSGWVILGALRHRVPGVHILRMALNVAIDTVVGAVPVLGDVFDILFKENVDKVELILRHRDPSRPARTAVGIWLSAAGIAAFLIGLFMVTMLAMGRAASWLIGR